MRFQTARRGMPRWICSLTAHIPPPQLGRYLLVGIWNTAFAYGTYAGFNFVLAGRIPYSYLVASILSSVLNITVSFLGYKWFVFKTKGHYWKEWLRSLSVYSTTIGLGLVALPALVSLFRNVFGFQNAAPYIAGAVLTGITVILSFFGHKHISFRRKG